MKKLDLSFLILVVSCCAVVFVGFSVALNCTGVVSHVVDGPLRWLGQIDWTVPVSTGPSGWSLTLYFDQNFVGIGVWKGFVTSNGTERWAEIRNRNSSDAQLMKGENRSMRFRVNYGFDIPTPQVVSLRFQDVELCD